MERAYTNRSHLATSQATNVLLWVAQGLLAAVFLFAGGMKLVLPVAELTRQMPLPEVFLRATGVVEVLGALGLVLPGLLHRRPMLTSAAAVGLVLVMCGATGVALATASPATGGLAGALIPVAVGLVLTGVAYGRWRAPHRAPRRARVLRSAPATA